MSNKHKTHKRCKPYGLSKEQIFENSIHEGRFGNSICIDSQVHTTKSCNSKSSKPCTAKSKYIKLCGNGIPMPSLKELEDLFDEWSSDSNQDDLVNACLHFPVVDRFKSPSNKIETNNKVQSSSDIIDLEEVPVVLNGNKQIHDHYENLKHSLPPNKQSIIQDSIGTIDLKELPDVLKTKLPSHKENSKHLLTAKNWIDYSISLNGTLNYNSDNFYDPEKTIDTDIEIIELPETNVTNKESQDKDTASNNNMIIVIDDDIQTNQCNQMKNTPMSNHSINTCNTSVNSSTCTGPSEIIDIDIVTEQNLISTTNNCAMNTTLSIGTLLSNKDNTPIASTSAVKVVENINIEQVDLSPKEMENNSLTTDTKSLENVLEIESDCEVTSSLQTKKCVNDAIKIPAQFISYLFNARDDKMSSTTSNRNVNIHTNPLNSNPVSSYLNRNKGKCTMCVYGKCKQKHMYINDEECKGLYLDLRNITHISFLNALCESDDTKEQTTLNKGNQEPETGFGNCPICMESFKQKPIASTLCGHIFCLDCITLATKTKPKKCPKCRMNLKGIGFHQIYI